MSAWGTRVPESRVLRPVCVQRPEGVRLTLAAGSPSSCSSLCAALAHSSPRPGTLTSVPPVEPRGSCAQYARLLYGVGQVLQDRRMAAAGGVFLCRVVLDAACLLPPGVRHLWFTPPSSTSGRQAWGRAYGLHRQLHTPAAPVGGCTGARGKAAGLREAPSCSDVSADNTAAVSWPALLTMCVRARA